MRLKVCPLRILAVPLAMLACFTLTLPVHADPPSALQAPLETPGSAARIARMEAELKAMQEEAARNPSRPTVAQLERELNQMIAERNAREARRNELARTQRLMTLSFGLNLVLAAVLALALAQRRRASASLAG